MSTSLNNPSVIKDKAYQFDSFNDGKVLLGAKKNLLPAMGWNSWNAFGSGNTEALTKTMADRFIELGLDKLGYKYLVLDDGCYKSERVDGLLSNDEVKFPSGFKALADYIHAKGLKFGMYNDVGTNLCAGAAVGTCGHEDEDAASYISWDIDFIKVDNCYYPWDNATFSDAKNAKYVYAPNIRSIRITSKAGDEVAVLKVKDAKFIGVGCELKDDYITGIGSTDGTGPVTNPIGAQSGEAHFKVDVAAAGEYELFVTYASGEEVNTGSWLQVSVNDDGELFYDDFLPATADALSFVESKAILINLNAGENTIRIMNHRRQENTLNSYAAFLEGLNKAKPNHDVLLSMCEWGKTNPHNWGYKVGDSWRILNDITFEVGSDGTPGKAHWSGDYTCAITAQYNKAVIMDEFAGLDKGWNDPDMLVIGMDGITLDMNKTHMVMWCMMNSPLMLGMDLRRIKSKDDEYYKIIANKDLIELNQDALGIQAKRVAVFMGDDEVSIENPDTTYIRDNNRSDVLIKPLANGDIALSVINLREESESSALSLDVKKMASAISSKLCDAEAFSNAKLYNCTNLWTKESFILEDGMLEIAAMPAATNMTYRIKAN